MGCRLWLVTSEMLSNALPVVRVFELRRGPLLLTKSL